MFKKKNKIVPKIKAKEMIRAKADDNLAKFFNTQIRVEMGNRNYITTLYVAPQETKCCNIL